MSYWWGNMTDGVWCETANRVVCVQQLGPTNEHESSADDAKVSEFKQKNRHGYLLHSETVRLKAM